MERRHLNRDLIKAVAMACIVAVPLTACDDDDDPIAPPPPDRGTVELAMTDDTGEATFIEGTFEGDVRVEFFTDGEWEEVTGLQSNVTFDLGGDDETIGSVQVDAATYDQARVVVSNASVVVPEGTVIGEAEPLAEDVTVVIADEDEVVAVYNLPVVIQEDGTIRFLLDLNSHVWLNEAAVTTGAVTATAFENAVQLSAP